MIEQFLFPALEWGSQVTLAGGPWTPIYEEADGGR